MTGVLILAAIFLVSLTLWTFVGNALVLIVLCLDAKLRTTSNLLIGNLAISDFLLAVTVLPFSLSQDLQQHWIFGKLACFSWLSLDVLYCTASVWGLVAIAFDRFTATVFPMWYRANGDKRRALPYISVVWFLSLLICAPSLYLIIDERSSTSEVSSRFAPINDTRNWVWDNTTATYHCVLYYERVYVVYSALGSFLIPLVLMIALYVKIFRVLHHRSWIMMAATSSIPSMNHAVTAMELPAGPAPTADTRGDKEDANILSKHHSTAITTSGNNSDSNVFITHATNLTKVMGEESPLLLPPSLDEGTSLPSGLQHSLVVPCPSAPLLSVPVPTWDSLPNHSSFHSQQLTTKSSAPFLQIPQASSSLCPTEEPSMNQPSTDLATDQGDNLSGNPSPNSAPPPIRRRSTLALLFRWRTDSLTRAELREMRATKRMSLVISIFALCWIPFTVMYLVRAWLEPSHIGNNGTPRTIRNAPYQRPSYGQMCLIWLGYSNSAINPILYTIFSRDFRRAFRKFIKSYIFCCCVRWRTTVKRKRTSTLVKQLSINVEQQD